MHVCSECYIYIRVVVVFVYNNLMKFFFALYVLVQSWASVCAMIFQELRKLCRLCFKNTGDNDVTTAPILLKAIKDFYNVEVSPE